MDDFSYFYFPIEWSLQGANLLFGNQAAGDEEEAGLPPVEEAGLPPVEEAGLPPVDEAGLPPVEEAGDEVHPPVEEAGDEVHPPVEEAAGCDETAAGDELTSGGTVTSDEIDTTVFHHSQAGDDERPLGATVTDSTSDIAAATVGNETDETGEEIAEDATITNEAQTVQKPEKDDTTDIATETAAGDELTSGGTVTLETETASASTATTATLLTDETVTTVQDSKRVGLDEDKGENKNVEGSTSGTKKGEPPVVAPQIVHDDEPVTQRVILRELQSYKKTHEEYIAQCNQFLQYPCSEADRKKQLKHVEKKTREAKEFERKIVSRSSNIEESVQVLELVKAEKRKVQQQQQQKQDILNEDHLHQMKEEFGAYRVKLSEYKAIICELNSLGVSTAITPLELKEMEDDAAVAEGLVMSAEKDIKSSDVADMREQRLELDEKVFGAKNDLNKAKRKMQEKKK